MPNSSSTQDREAILNAISKHPNTKFAKLFREVDDSPNQKNIVLLLIELTQQKDFYVDFRISLQYFLNLYEKLDAANKEFLFNEAGLLIFNATQIYSRRVDCIQQRLEDQLAELSKGQESKEKNSADETSVEPEKSEKPKRRKRLVEDSDPYEIEVVTRKFRKLSAVKRFAGSTKLDTSKIFSTNLHTETYTHPALWQHAEIIDLENDELDSKKNYRLFISHVEHRYNTLMPDINFLLYYKMKDFMEEEDERDGEGEFCQHSDWPPLSQAYLTRYLKLEDQALALNKKEKFDEHKTFSSLHQKIKASNITDSIETCATKTNENSDEKANLDTSQSHESNNLSTERSQTDSGIGTSVLELSSDFQENTLDMDKSLQLEETVRSNGENESKLEATSNLNSIQLQPDTADSNNVEKNMEVEIVNPNLSESVNNDLLCEAINSTMNSEMNLEQNKANGDTETDKSTNNTTTKTQVDLKETHQTGTLEEDIEGTMEIIVHIDNRNENCENKERNINAKNHVSRVSTDLCASLSPTNDEGVYFSDIDDSPFTPITSPITIRLDLNTLSEGKENENNTQKVYGLPAETMPTEWPIEINIFEFPPNVLKKMRKKLLLTHLGDDMELFLKSRCYKRSRIDPVTTPRQYKVVSNWIDFSPPSPGDTNLLGFLENGEMVIQRKNEKIGDITASPRRADSSLRLSRDSGVGNELLTASPEKNIMFFPPICEESDDDIRKDLFSNNERNEIEILEDLRLNENLNKEDDSAMIDERSIENQADCAKSVLLARDCETSSTQIPQENINTNPETHFPIMPDSIDSESSKLNEHLELSENIAAKIQKWHRHLQPILANSSQRHHFDVFKIGTNIIDEFDHFESITFQDVMKHNDPSYVSRYFLSTLLLANQGNLELNVNNQSDSSPSEWHDVNLKLISKTRHVVSMEDNIGLTSVKTVANEPSNLSAAFEVKTQSPPAKKRCLNVNINQIEIIKPIRKVLRKSNDYDSGIYSNDDLDNL